MRIQHGPPGDCEAGDDAAIARAESLLVPQAALESSWSRKALAAFCGIVNNASFCVLLGASQEIAKEFGQSQYQPLIVNISTAGSVAGVFFSSKVMVGRMGDRSRLIFICLGNICGYLLIGTAYRVFHWEAKPNLHDISPSWGFWLCTLGAFILGFMQSAGEVMNLGLYRNYAPGMLSSWGAGTGLSGIVGPFLFIALHDAGKLDVGNIAFVVAAFVPLYFAAFASIVADRNRRTVGRAMSEMEVDGGAKEGQSVGFSWSNLLVVWRFSGSVLGNMVAVYALEYMITSGFMQITTSCPPTRSWIGQSDNNNPLLWAMYNVGVTLSRASVSCFRIRRIELLTCLQALNVVVWGLFASAQWVARWHSDAPLYVACVHMIFVGFMGGACYSNCMYLFNTKAGLPEKYRELGINMGFFFSNIGIILATGLVTLLKVTALSQDALFPPNGTCPELLQG